MKMDTLFENFQMLADASNGVPKLREMILQLAVQGNLVPQNPKDEPASFLLEKIKTEKDRFIKEKKIRKAKPLPPAKEDEIPYELPEGWEWVRLDEICIIKGGKRVPKGYQLLESKTPYVYIRVTDLKNKTIEVAQLKYITKDVYEQIKMYIINKEDVYITIAGTIGAVGEVPKMFDGANLTENAAKLMFSGFVKKYLIWALSANVVQEQFKKSFKQMAQPKLALNKIAKTVFPLPPFNEQKRIVAKVDQLIELCDDLEAQKQKRDESRIALSDAALDRLLSAQKQKDFTKHWKRISNNFELLYDNPENVDKLRQAILQLAVLGKLVPQDPKDEPASVLLEKIKAEKERLLKEKKIKKTKPLSLIAPDEFPYELPGNWEWTKLAEIGLINPRNEIEDGKEVSFIPMKLVPTVFGNKIESEKREWKDIKKGFTHFAEGDVAIAKITPCFQNRKSVVMRSLINGFGAGTTELHIFRSINEQVIPEYVLLYLKTSKFIMDGVDRMTGSAGQKRVPKTYFSENPFPLPPLKEQKRIVAKVEQFMFLCDKLKAKLSRSQSDCDDLLSAIVNDIENGCEKDKAKMIEVDKGTAKEY